MADIKTISEDTANTTSPSVQGNDRSKTAKIMVLLLLFSLVAVAVVYMTELNAQPENHQLLVLPIDNQVADEKLAWVSLGLMSLAAKVIESNSDVWVMSERESLKTRELLGESYWPLHDNQVLSLKKDLAATFVVASNLSLSTDSLYQLAFEVHHPKGVYSESIIHGDNPTKMVEQMASQVARLLPGKKTKKNYTVISGDDFTNELYSRGMSFHIQGYVDKAQNYLELAIEQDDSLLLPKFKLAVVKRKQNKLEESKQELEQLLQDFDSYQNAPTDKIKLLNSLGVTYLRMLNNEKATEKLMAAYELAQKVKAYRLVVKTANNMAIIARRQQNTDEARKWASEALAVVNKHQIPNKPGVVYLLGQIERDSGKIDKALSLFNEAHNGYLETHRLKEASAILSATGDLLRKKGQFKLAHEAINKALELKAEINDKLGLVDSRLYQIELSIVESDWEKSQQLLDELHDFVKEHNITTRANDIFKVVCQLHFAQGNYQQVVDMINTEGAGIKSRNLDMIKLKSLQQLGDQTVIKTWLQEHQHFKSGDNNMMRMYWLDFENYYLEAHGRIESLIESYQQRLTLSRLMGYDAWSARLLLKSGYQHLRLNAPDKAQSILHELRSLPLDWWEIDLYEALVLHAQADFAANDLVSLAKSKAKHGWLPKHEEVLLQINKSEAYQPPVEAVLF